MCHSILKLNAFLLVASVITLGASTCFAQRSSLFQDPASIVNGGQLQSGAPETSYGNQRINQAGPTDGWRPPQANGNFVNPMAGLLDDSANSYAGVRPAVGNQLAGQGQSLANASWIYTPLPPPRVLQIHDLVSIRVDETSQTTASGQAQARKNASLDILLSDWVRFDGLDTIKPTNESDGEPRLAGQNNEVYRADSTLRTRESMTFNIKAEIADIRPNGLLVLSATKGINDNDNRWELSLSGICRPTDIGPDNVVLSRDIFDLNISKNEAGQVRDGYSRGWVSKWFGRFKPF